MQEKTAVLLSSLDNKRDHLLGILDGHPEEILHPGVAIRLDLPRMVRHLALSVERFWFREIVAGESFDSQHPDLNAEAAWLVPAGMAADVVFNGYRQEIAPANAIITATPLAAPPARWRDDLWPDWRLHDLGEVVPHMITETACHAGHLDAVRELSDGRLWFS